MEGHAWRRRAWAALSATVFILRCGVASGGLAVDMPRPVYDQSAKSALGPLPGHLRVSEQGGKHDRVPACGRCSIDVHTSPHTTVDHHSVARGMHLRGGQPVAGLNKEAPRQAKSEGATQAPSIGEVIGGLFGFIQNNAFAGFMRSRRLVPSEPPDPTEFLQELQAAGDDKCPRIINLAFKQGIIGKKGSPAAAAGAEALLIMARHGRVRGVQALAKLGVDLDGAFVNGTRSVPLHFAAAGGKLLVVDTLCQLGAAVDCRDSQGWTALHQAAFFGQADVTKRLVLRWNASRAAATDRKSVV